MPYLAWFLFLFAMIPASPAHETIRSAVQSAMLKSSPVFGDFALWSVFSATVKLVAAVHLSRQVQKNDFLLTDS